MTSEPTRTTKNFATTAEKTKTGRTRFIRNLREETIKGITGRLKQGNYPFAAPLGYLNNGGGKVKTIDPVRGPMVRRIFKQYATGQYSLHSLVPEAKRLGLTNRNGRPLTKSGIEKILQNTFYCGIIHIKTTGITYQGGHEPMISPGLFQTVQDIRAGKSGKKVTKHLHTYRGLFTCASCRTSMTPELQKGHVYYRCHAPLCEMKTVREEVLEQTVTDALSKTHLTDASVIVLDDRMTAWCIKRSETDPTVPHRLQLAKIEQRLERLTDALIDQQIDEQSYTRRKQTLLMERAAVTEKIAGAAKQTFDPDHLRSFLELVKNLAALYVIATKDEKRQIVQLATSNRIAKGKNVCVEPADWLFETQLAVAVSCGDPPRTTLRTSPDLMDVQMGALMSAANSQPALQIREVLCAIESRQFLKA